MAQNTSLSNMDFLGNLTDASLNALIVTRSERRSADLEKSTRILVPDTTEVLQAATTSASLSLPEFLVDWESPNDPSNPKNWSSKKRWTATLLVSLFASIYPIGSTMISPCMVNISNELHISIPFLEQLSLSIFLLGIGVGPLVLSPLSEVYGRIPILHSGTFFYLIWNTVCGFSQSSQQLIAFRFFSGFGASAALSVGSGVMGDLWKPEERGKAVAVYVLGPLLAPAFGPIAGAYITQGASWRWVFWGMSIATLATQTVAALFLRETYGPRILRKKVSMRRKRTGSSQWYSSYDEPGKSISKLVARSLIRPFRLLGTHPIIQLLSLYVGFFYGVLYIMLFTFPFLWTDHYHQSTGTSSLNYISTGIGYIFGSQVAGPVNDKIYRAMKAKYHGVDRAEFRVPLMIAGSLITATGLFLYGWTGQKTLHWIIPNIGAAIFTTGLMLCFQGAQTFSIDIYTIYAASASSTMAFTRSLAGFGFPLFAPYMYKQLGYGVGNTIIAVSAAGIGCGIPIALWSFAARLKKTVL